MLGVSVAIEGFVVYMYIGRDISCTLNVVLHMSADELSCKHVR